MDVWAKGILSGSTRKSLYDNNVHVWAKGHGLQQDSYIWELKISMQVPSDSAMNIHYHHTVNLPIHMC